MASDHEFVVQPDDTELVADGADTTRVVLRMNDTIRRHPAVCQRRDHAGAGRDRAMLIGDNPATLIGGAVAVWVRAGEQPGDRHVSHAKHPAPRHKGSQEHQR